MYHHSQNSHFRGNRGSNSFAPRTRFKPGKKRFEKKLDPNLFIKKAEDLQTQHEYVTTVQFSDFAVVDKLKHNIQEHGYTKPTAIQEKAIPEIIRGQDIIGIANTGTGKTAAFLISLINKVYLDRQQRVLIVVPTRELAIQIQDEFRIFARSTGIEAVAVVGGTDIYRQTQALHHSPSFVIGTPGRLKDLIERRVLNLSLFQNIVLDEVDRMVDIGFIKDIRYLIALLPQERQSLFFSATVSGETREILNSFVHNPVTVSVKQQNTSANVEQNIIKVKDNATKVSTLESLLQKQEFQKVLVFGRTKWGIEKLTKELLKKGFKAVAIHGNKSQNQRQRALQLFKQNHVQVLLATDVASRGIDIDNVTHVINYDAPTSYEDYVHRIGRTGRAGKRGIALTFVD